MNKIPFKFIGVLLLSAALVTAVIIKIKRMKRR